MKKRKNELQDELRAEYDLRGLLRDGVRGKYAKKYRQGTNLVLLAPDVAKAFANDEDAVNKTLRLAIQMTKIQKRKNRGLAKA